VTRLARRTVLAALAAALAAPGRAAETDQGPGAPQFGAEVPYVQTPLPVVDAMLGIAGARAGDRLIDLGSGDGRLVIEAARRYGVPGLGVELDPNLVELSRERARQAGVEALARFAVGDLFDTDLADATLITLYLLPEVNLALRPRLLRLAPGTRVVSHDWDMGDWQPDRSLIVAAPNKPVGLRRESAVHLWVVPAAIQGDWRGRLAGEPDALLTVRIAQRYQELQVSWRLDGSPPDALPRTGVAQARMLGDATSVAMPGPRGPVRMALRLRAGRIEAELAGPGGQRHIAVLQAV
jgi:SAM-dependent methyltransferase